MLYLFYFYVFLIPLEYLQEKIPKGFTGVNYLNAMMLAMLLWWLIQGGRNGRRRALPTPLNLLLLVFLGYSYVGLCLTAMTVPGAEYPIVSNNESFTFFLRLFNGYLFFWLAANMLDTRRKVRWCLYAIGLSMPLVFRAFRSDIGLHSTAVYRNLLRFQGPFVYIGSNELAALFLIGCVFFGLFALAQRKWWEKLAFAAASGLYAYGVLYSYSRGTQIALVVVAMLAASLRYRWVLIVILLALATQGYWVPSSVRQRWEMTENAEGQLDPSAESRTEFWSLAWNLFNESPIYGRGVQSFKQINPAKMDTHNVYLRMLAEQGVIGFVLFIGIWISILRLAFSLWTRAPDRWDRHFGFALLMTTVGLMIANLFGDRFTHLALIGQYWVLVGLAQRLHANMTGVEALAEDDENVPTTSAAASPAHQPALSLVRPTAEACSDPAPPLPVASEVGATNGRPALNIVGRSVPSAPSPPSSA